VVGGLLFSQLLTLFVTPVFYVYMDKLQRKLRGGRGTRPWKAEREEKPEASPVRELKQRAYRLRSREHGPDPRPAGTSD
jgi:hypothetical protein